MAETPRFTALDVPRHRCYACSHSCTGHWIEIGEDEAPGIERLAASLGVENPIVDGGLRVEGGTCVFLASDGLCSLHKQWGPEAKPVVCRQYPFVAVEIAPDTYRVGIDPGCTHAWQTWRDGPEATPDRMRPKRRALHPEQQEAERGLVGMLSEPGLTVADALHRLCTGQAGGPDLPAGFAGRWVHRLQAVPWTGLLQDPDTGLGIRDTLHTLARATSSWDPAEPPPWPGLDPEVEAWAIETARRMVYLRLASLLPSVQAVALLALGGAVAAAWTEPELDRFGPALAGWSRAIRRRDLWRPLIPESATLAWLATGERS